MTQEDWVQHAEWWQHRFTDGVDPEYVRQLIPTACKYLRDATHVLDMGCGEGHVARALALQGTGTIGIDPIASLIDTAVERGGGPVYARAVSDTLPFKDASFDGVVVCGVLELVDKLDESIVEIARVLEPRGRFVFLLNHPMQTADSFLVVNEEEDPPDIYWRMGPYIPESVLMAELQEEVTIRFLHRPMERYMNAIIDSGMNLDTMLELIPPIGFNLTGTKDPMLEARVVASMPRWLGLIFTRQ